MSLGLARRICGIVSYNGWTLCYAGEWELWRVGSRRLFVERAMRGSYTGNSQAMNNQAGVRMFASSGESSFPSAVLLWVVVFEAAGVASGRSSSSLLDLEDGVSEMDRIHT